MLLNPRAIPPDFDAWMTLAQQDPEGFEAMRIEAINDYISQLSAERQLQLRRLQWRIDRERERAGTALGACVAISRMMWDSFSHLRQCYQDAFETTTQPASIRKPLPLAKVLEFRSRPEMTPA